jgi:hypothetical protein
MRRSLRIFALLMAASMLIWVAGCGDDEEEEEKGPAPEVESSVPAAGATIAGNASVTFTLNVKLDEASVSGAAGTTTIEGKNVIFTPTTDMPAGPVSLTLTGTSADGQEVSHTLSFTAGAVDRDPPELVDSKCDPKNGATGVDPADYPEAITVVFNEDVAEAVVTSAEPEFKFTEEIAGDTLTINFLQYSMPNETEYTIGVTAKDAAGNEAELEYSFTTMAKEE